MEARSAKERQLPRPRRRGGRLLPPADWRTERVRRRL